MLLVMGMGIILVTWMQSRNLDAPVRLPRLGAGVKTLRLKLYLQKQNVCQCLCCCLCSSLHVGVGTAMDYREDRVRVMLKVDGTVAFPPSVG